MRCLQGPLIEPLFILTNSTGNGKEYGLDPKTHEMEKNGILHTVNSDHMLVEDSLIAASHCTV